MNSAEFFGIIYLQVKDFVELGRPVGVFGLGDKLSFLVGEVGPDEVHLHVRLERLRLGRLQVIGRHHYNTERKKKL